MPFNCPNKNPKPFTLKQILEMLDQDNDFAAFFAKQLDAAFGGNQAAIDCVDSYLKPTWTELDALNLPADKKVSSRHCTDSGVLVVARSRPLPV